MSPRFALVLLAFLPACGGSRPADGTRTSTPATVRVSTTGGRTVALATTSTSEVAGITVNAPIERVWQALPAVYAELEVPVKSLMTNERMVG
ncbi:MAG TPA: hypothetical protein VFY16_12125, partial [Gemmatimonadaceae bacterium]|nr:hypothetical protein [Gemmatimonadaceae bacterium]